MSDTALLWLRRDLRIADNPALAAAMAGCDQVLPIYIHAPEEESPWAPGAASRWWLHHSLAALDAALRERGSRLAIAVGDSLEVLTRVATETGARRIYWNRLYDPATLARDARIKTTLREQGLHCESHNALLLHEPWEVLNGSRQAYRVYSAYWRRTSSLVTSLPPSAAPDRLASAPPFDGVPLAALGLLPQLSWDEGFAPRWRPGEVGALERARDFIRDDVADYGERRNLPDCAGTSSLSPHLHFGEIGPRQILALVQARDWGDDTPQPGPTLAPAAEPFVREIVWREFAYHLLYHFPATPLEPLDQRFAAFPWREADREPLLTAWRRGQTGIPMVDAGMRELWHTGWMHNRVRMIVASLLTKNLRLPWQEGALWFWDTLVDADLASNTLGWQWSAGCGADAAPYFRVFNPVLQGQRFDPEGDYVRHWCPELARLPATWIHQPWKAPAALLHSAGVSLGRDYPHPVVDLAQSRVEALAAFETIKSR